MVKICLNPEQPINIDFADDVIVLFCKIEDKKVLYILNKKGTKTLVINQLLLFLQRIIIIDHLDIISMYSSIGVFMSCTN